LLREGGNVGKIDRAWFDEPEIKTIRFSSKDRITTFFEVENRAVTPGYILHKLKIDHKTIKRVMDVMVRHNILEKIETTNYTQYRRVPDVN